MKIWHPKKLAEGEAAAATEDAENNNKIFRQLTRVSESEKSHREKIQQVLDAAAAKTNKAITTRLAIKRLSDAEEDELFRTVRWSYLQHSELLKIYSKGSKTYK